MIGRIWGFLHARTDRRTLEAFRIALGAVSFLWLLAGSFHWSRDYGPDGMMAQFSRTEGPTWGWRLLEILPGHESTLLVIGVALHLLFIAGIRARECSAGLWLWHHALLSINFVAANSEQFMFRWMFLYGIFLPWGRMWAWRSGRSSGRTVRSWALRLVQVQVVLVYLISTLAKLVSDRMWRDGEAVYYVLSDPLWSRVAGQSWYLAAGVPEFLTYSSLFLEGAFPFVIWWKRARPFLVAALVLFHLGLALVMQHIGFFSLSMAVALMSWWPTTFRKNWT